MANTKVSKITKKDKFAMLLAIKEVAENPMLVEFINHELDLLAKKNATDKKPTALQLANQSIQQAILDTMISTNKKYTITDLIKEIPECADCSNQKISVLVKQMVDADLVCRVEEKKKAYFYAK